MNRANTFLFSGLVVAWCCCAGGCGFSVSEPAFDLSGEWKYTVGDDMVFRHPQFDDSSWRRIEIPGSIKTPGDPPLIAWCRKTVVLARPPQGATYGLYIGNLYDADETYLNGVLIGSKGTVGQASDRYYGLPRLYPIPEGLVRPGANLVAVRLSGYRYFEAGPVGGPVEIAPYLGLERAQFYRELVSLFQCSVMGVVGAYFLLLFVRLSAIRSHLFFSLTLLDLALYTLLRTPFAHDWFGNFALVKRVEYVALFLIPIPFVAFWTEFYSRRHQAPQLALYCGAAACTATVCLNPDIQSWQLLLAGVNYTMAAVLLFLLGYISHKIAQGDRPSRAVGLGALVLILSIGNDILSERGWTNAPRVAQFGFLVFVAFIAATLVRFFVDLQRQAETTVLRLREVDRMKDLYLENATDSFNGPISLLRAASQNLEMGNLSKVQRFGERLNLAVSRVLFISRLQAGGEEAHLSHMDRTEIMRNLKLTEGTPIPEGVSMQGSSETLATLRDLLKEKGGGADAVAAVEGQELVLSARVRIPQKRRTDTLGDELLREIGRLLRAEVTNTADGISIRLPLRAASR